MTAMTANQLDPEAIVSVAGLAKAFTLHTQGGVELPVWRDLDLTVRAGECVVLSGPSGSGKSSLLRCIYGNYLSSRGGSRCVTTAPWRRASGSVPLAPSARLVTDRYPSEPSATIWGQLLA